VTKYLFRRDDTGELVELEMALDELMERQESGRIVLDDGVPATRAITEEFERDLPKRSRVRRGGSCWPKESDSLGCHPEQAAEFNEEMRRGGVRGVYFDPRTGACTVESRKAQRDACKAFGLINKDGGYGDTYNSHR
jgi:hypothetical protein